MNKESKPVLSKRQKKAAKKRFKKQPNQWHPITAQDVAELLQRRAVTAQ